MCGIVGMVKFNGRVDGKQFEKMTKAIAHRGPDDEGYLFGNSKTGAYLIAGGGDTPKNVFGSNYHYTPRVLIDSASNSLYNLALSNRRLAILDLSAAGHQPMCNEDETIWIVYNGEIYNYKEIRDDLMSKGHKFISDSDTEVIIKAYEEWDVDCLNKFNGMWAFCIWDIRRKKLFCARDRLGIKPFYYYCNDDLFVFGSEIKSLMESNIPRKPNDALVFDFLKVGLLDHTDETLFAGIKKLPQAHYLIIDVQGNIKINQYWDLQVSNRTNDEYDETKCSEDFLNLFIDAIKLRLRSDVPIGSCLSGGLDSSSIVCIVNTLMYPGNNLSAHERQKTFSSCFDDSHFDEREYIEEVIKKTNAENNYIFPDPKMFMKELDKLLWHQEEPFGGTSIYAQWCVLKKAREKGVIVLLDGQGADEQLAGYRKFYIFYFLELLKNKNWSRLIVEFSMLFISSEVIKTLNIRHGLKYFKFSNNIMNPEELLIDSFKHKYLRKENNIGFSSNLGDRIREDLLKLSLPVLLRFEDKNSMAHSIEARLPFLDYRIVEKLASFPITQKLRNGWTKYVLRQAMNGILPDKIRLRKSKLGFVTPEDSWFKKVIGTEVKNIFNEAIFILDYADKKQLNHYFDKYLTKTSLYQSDIFFRFFILELWGRKFLYN